jgi:hypothetical protein
MWTVGIRDVAERLDGCGLAGALSGFDFIPGGDFIQSISFSKKAQHAGCDQPDAPV